MGGVDAQGGGTEVVVVSGQDGRGRKSKACFNLSVQAGQSKKKAEVDGDTQTAAYRGLADGDGYKGWTDRMRKGEGDDGWRDGIARQMAG